MDAASKLEARALFGALGAYFALLERKGCLMPVLEVDARKKQDVLRLQDAFPIGLGIRRSAE